jgi:hypothetical protein
MIFPPAWPPSKAGYPAGSESRGVRAFGQFMRSSLTQLLLIAIAACALGPSREQVLAQYVGASEQTIVQVFGVPNRTYATGGVKYLAYDQRRAEVIPPPPAPYPWGWGWGWYGPFPPDIVTFTCETTFEIADGRVRAFTLRGNAC